MLAIHIRKYFMHNTTRKKKRNTHKANQKRMKKKIDPYTEWAKHAFHPMQISFKHVDFNFLLLLSARASMHAVYTPFIVASLILFSYA